MSDRKSFINTQIESALIAFSIGALSALLLFIDPKGISIQQNSASSYLTFYLINICWAVATLALTAGLIHLISKKTRAMAIQKSR